ncbi:MAG: hypothetical protein K0Q51_375 [Rickettsiaceae bacterium]|jgi:HK97 family phage prohead protease|nr:hypothetical protein [Rickettsiaceae bacterium]
MVNIPNFEQKFYALKSSSIGLEGCRIKGYASVFNVIDNHSDLIVKGAFENSIKKHFRDTSIKLLWQHNQAEPIGVIDELYEDEIGLFMTASINNHTQRGREVISLIQQKAINGLSIGFKIEDVDYDKQGIRVIKKVDLWEVSIVTFPANEHAQINSLEKNISKYDCGHRLEQTFNHALNIISKMNINF